MHSANVLDRYVCSVCWMETDFIYLLETNEERKSNKASLMKYLHKCEMPVKCELFANTECIKINDLRVGKFSYRLLH